MAYKWLPVISTDNCTGCSKCVDACDHGCLELVWSFATLQRPANCGSEGTCVEACPEDVIRMQWVPITADQKIGRWREELERVENQRKSWLQRVFQVR